MVTQHQSQCQQHGPLSEPALTVTSINIECKSAAKQQLLTELCEKQKCDVLCVQESNTTQNQRHESGCKFDTNQIHNLLMDEMDRKKMYEANIVSSSRVRKERADRWVKQRQQQYGSAIFVRNNCICDLTSTSNTNNVEIIQAQLNKLTVTSVYKPPNEQFRFGSNLASTQMNVVIGDFNSHGVEWGYRSTDENSRLVEQWSETNQLSLVHDAKQPKSFNSKRWQQGYNPDLAFVSYSIAHLAEKDVMDAIPKTQHIPISIKLNAAIRPRNFPFRTRYNLKKAKWQSYAKEVDNGIANTNPVPENYEKFVNLVRRSSNKNIPRGCRTSYVCGLNDQSKDMYEDYQRRFAEDPFNEDTVRVGDVLLDEISEAQRSKWKEIIESTDFTHSSRKAWKTINTLTKKLHRTSAAM